MATGTRANGVNLLENEMGLATASPLKVIRFTRATGKRALNMALAGSFSLMATMREIG